MPHTQGIRLRQIRAKILLIFRWFVLPQRKAMGEYGEAGRGCIH
jgi:hypothetical protein